MCASNNILRSTKMMKAKEKPILATDIVFMWIWCDCIIFNQFPLDCRHSVYCARDIWMNVCVNMKKKTIGEWVFLILDSSAKYNFWKIRYTCKCAGSNSKCTIQQKQKQLGTLDIHLNTNDANWNVQRNRFETLETTANSNRCKAEL